MKSWPSPREVPGRWWLVSSSAASLELPIANLLFVAADTLHALLTRGETSAPFSALPPHPSCQQATCRAWSVCLVVPEVTPVEDHAPSHPGFARYNWPSTTFASFSEHSEAPLSSSSSSVLVLSDIHPELPSFSSVTIKFLPQIIILLLHFLNHWIISLISV